MLAYRLLMRRRGKASWLMHFAHHYVGCDVARVDRRVLRAGELLQANEIASGQQVEVRANDFQRQLLSGVRGQGEQLQGQAFLSRARPDTGRVEILQIAQGDLQFFGLDAQVGCQGLGQLLERNGQVAVVVECIDQALDERTVLRRQIEQAQLPGEVLAQRSGCRLDVVAVTVVVVERARGAAVAGVVCVAEPAVLFASWGGLFRRRVGTGRCAFDARI